MFMQNQYTNVDSSFIHNNLKLETTQMSFNRWLVKQPAVHPCHAALPSNNMEWTPDTHHNLDGSQGKKAKLKGYILYDFIYITFVT